MKSIATFLLFTFCLCNVQGQSTEDWKMPMKDGFVFFQDTSKLFNNKKHTLCSYLVSDLFRMNLQLKLNSILESMGGKLYSNTNYTLDFSLGTAADNVDVEKGVMIDCNTISNQGFFAITIAKEKTILWEFPTLNSKRFKASGVTCALRVDILDNNKYVLTFKGFTLRSGKFTLSKGYQSTDQTLEEVYDAFSKSEKKSKDQIEFFKDIKQLISIFKNNLSEQLDRTIKVDEL